MIDKSNYPRLAPHPQDHKMEVYAQRIVEYRQSIREFIKDMWGLTPQIVKPEYAERWQEVELATGDNWEKLKLTVNGYWFGDPVNPDRPDLDWVWYDFQKGKHFTWQQNLILMGVEKAARREARLLLSIVSGHGIGKSATCSWIIIWFLHCFYMSQVPVTAPTSHQMHDVLWKEISIWLSRMPEIVRPLYEWQSDYVRMTAQPEAWFARARTSTKENTEAIAGVHADHVAIVVDEASGVVNKVFETAEGALTSGNVLVVLISNGTQPTGYFFDTHHRNKHEWQNFCFNGEESPIVDRAFIALKIKHGPLSDEYKIRVKGGFPGESAMDDSGYLQLIPPQRVIIVPKVTNFEQFIKASRKILGIDPSGEGKDKATWTLRDRFKAEKIFELQTTNPREIAEHTLTFIDRYGLSGEDVVVDGLGVGATVGQEIAVASNGKYNVYTVLVGTHPADEEAYNGHLFQRLEEEVEDGKDLYLNLRALMYFRALRWILAGGQVVDTAVDNGEFKNELSVIKYKRSLQGNKLQIMDKVTMKKLGIPSPNIADSFGLTFLRSLDLVKQTEEERQRILAEESQVDNPHSIF